MCARPFRLFRLQILLHPSDVVVSSIVSNPSIEAVSVPPVKTRLLRFDPLPADKVRDLMCMPARTPFELGVPTVATALVIIRLLCCVVALTSLVRWLRGRGDVIGCPTTTTWAAKSSQRSPVWTRQPPPNSRSHGGPFVRHMVHMSLHFPPPPPPPARFQSACLVTCIMDPTTLMWIVFFFCCLLCSCV